MVYAGESREKALEAFVLTDMAADESYLGTLYEYTEDGFLRHFLDYIPEVGVPHTKASKNLLKYAIKKYFDGNEKFTNIFFDYLMVWHPLDLVGDDSSEEDRVRDQIASKLREFIFPLDMILFIAKREAKEWCDLEISEYKYPSDKSVAPLNQIIASNKRRAKYKSVELSIVKNDQP